MEDSEKLRNEIIQLKNSIIEYQNNEEFLNSKIRSNESSIKYSTEETTRLRNIINELETKTYRLQEVINQVGDQDALILLLKQRISDSENLLLTSEENRAKLEAEIINRDRFAFLNHTNNITEMHSQLNLLNIPIKTNSAQDQYLPQPLSQINGSETNFFDQLTNLDQICNKCIELTKIIDDLKIVEVSLCRDKDNLNQEIENYKKELEQKELELLNEKTVLIELKEINQKHVNDINNYKNEIKTLNEKKKVLEKTVDESNKNIMKLNESIKKTQNDNTNALNSLKKDAEKMREEIKTLKTKSEDLTKKNKEIQTTYDTLKKENDNLKKNLVTAQKRVAVQENELEEYKKDDNTKEFNELKERIKELEIQRDHLVKRLSEEQKKSHNMIINNEDLMKNKNENVDQKKSIFADPLLPIGEEREKEKLTKQQNKKEEEKSKKKKKNKEELKKEEAKKEDSKSDKKERFSIQEIMKNKIQKEFKFAETRTALFNTYDSKTQTRAITSIFKDMIGMSTNVTGTATQKLDNSLKRVHGWFDINFLMFINNYNYTSFNFHTICIHMCKRDNCFIKKALNKGKAVSDALYDCSSECEEIGKFHFINYYCSTNNTIRREDRDMTHMLRVYYDLNSSDIKDKSLHIIFNQNEKYQYSTLVPCITIPLIDMINDKIITEANLLDPFRFRSVQIKNMFWNNIELKNMYTNENTKIVGNIVLGIDIYALGNMNEAWNRLIKTICNTRSSIDYDFSLYQLAMRYIFKNPCIYDIRSLDKVYSRAFVSVSEDICHNNLTNVTLNKLHPSTILGMVVINNVTAISSSRSPKETFIRININNKYDKVNRNTLTTYPSYTKEYNDNLKYISHDLTQGVTLSANTKIYSPTIIQKGVYLICYNGIILITVCENTEEKNEIYLGVEVCSISVTNSIEVLFNGVLSIPLDKTITNELNRFRETQTLSKKQAEPYTCTLYPKSPQLMPSNNYRFFCLATTYTYLDLITDPKCIEYQINTLPCSRFYNFILSKLELENKSQYKNYTLEDINVRNFTTPYDNNMNNPLSLTLTMVLDDQGETEFIPVYSFDTLPKHETRVLPLPETDIMKYRFDIFDSNGEILCTTSVKIPNINKSIYFHLPFYITNGAYEGLNKEWRNKTQLNSYHNNASNSNRGPFITEEQNNKLKLGDHHYDYLKKKFVRNGIILQSNFSISFLFRADNSLLFDNTSRETETIMPYLAPMEHNNYPIEVIGFIHSIIFDPNTFSRIKESLNNIYVRVSLKGRILKDIYFKEKLPYNLFNRPLPFNENLCLSVNIPIEYTYYTNKPEVTIIIELLTINCNYNMKSFEVKIPYVNQCVTYASTPSSIVLEVSNNTKVITKSHYEKKMFANISNISNENYTNSPYCVIGPSLYNELLNIYIVFDVQDLIALLGIDNNNTDDQFSRIVIESNYILDEHSRSLYLESDIQEISLKNKGKVRYSLMLNHLFISELVTKYSLEVLQNDTWHRIATDILVIPKVGMRNDFPLKLCGYDCSVGFQLESNYSYKSVLDKFSKRHITYYIAENDEIPTV